MATQRALVLSSKATPPTVQIIPIPTATPGSAVIRIHTVAVIPYMSSILNGSRPYPLSLPLVPGGSAIGRIHSVGPDAVTLSPDQLVFCDLTIRARDDSDSQILLGTHGGTPTSIRLMDGEWRNGTWAEYTKFPLENLYPIDEERVCGDLRYEIKELITLAVCAVPFGGLSALGVKPGETVIVAPATGYYGGAAVTVALALGCNVIAAGRSVEKLEALRRIHGKVRFKTVVLSGDVNVDTTALKEASSNKNGADAYIDFSPPEAGGSTHIMAALGALPSRGKAVLMGGIAGMIEIPYSMLMFKNLSIQGRFMFERKDVEKLIKLVESDILKLGEDIGMTNFQTFGLNDWEQAVSAAGQEKGWGSQVLMCP